MNERFSPMRRALIAVMASAGLGACGGYPGVQHDVDAAFKAAQSRAAQAKMPVAKLEKAPYVEFADRPFLGATSIPRPTDEALPSTFRRITLVFGGRYPLQEAASLITLATGLPVTLSPDLSGQAGAAQAASGGTSAATIVLNYRGSLGEALDGIAAQAGCSWQYKDGRLGFFRNLTRTFYLPYLPILDSAISMTVGQTSTAATGATGSAAATSTGGASSAFSTAMSYNFKPWEDLRNGIKDGILSPTGKAIVMPSAGTVTVTDGPRQVEEVERFVQEMNRYYGRQVAVRVEIVSLDLSETSEFGINWSLILNTLNALGNQQQYAFASPAGSASTIAGSAGITLIKQVNGVGDFSGSQALIKALSTLGKTHVQRTWETLALNRRVTPVATVRTTGYLAQTTPAVSTTAGATAGTPGLTPGSVTYGFTLQMVPTITSKNSLVLDFGMNLSDLKGITSVSSGTGANQQTIELPDTVASQMVPSVTMATGDTLVLSGLQQDNNNYNKRAFGRDVSPGLGGLFQGSTAKTLLLVLVTPVVADY